MAPPRRRHRPVRPRRLSRLLLQVGVLPASLAFHCPRRLRPAPASSPSVVTGYYGGGGRRRIHPVVVPRDTAGGGGRSTALVHATGEDRFDAALATPPPPPVAPGTDSAAGVTAELERLRAENDRLRQSLEDLHLEYARLQRDGGVAPQRIVLETFEGEGRLRSLQEKWRDGSDHDRPGEDAALYEDPSLWCDELQDGACPLEPTVGFGEALRDRAYWLVGLLVLQSLSGFILSRNEALLENHPFSKLTR